MSRGPLAVAHASLQAYVDKNRELIESLIGEEFQFTCPIDNAIDRDTYFSRCWPYSDSMQSVNFIHGAEIGDCAFITYEIQTIKGERFRNTELHTVRNNKLISIEVYFGWAIPHPAEPGDFVRNKGDGHA
jgi:hypothetical protein